MLSDEEKKELLEGAASAALRADFEIMSERVRRAGRNMGMDTLLDFLTSASRMFEPSRRSHRHEIYTRVLI